MILLFICHLGNVNACVCNKSPAEAAASLSIKQRSGTDPSHLENFSPYVPTSVFIANGVSSALVSSAGIRKKKGKKKEKRSQTFDSLASPQNVQLRGSEALGTVSTLILQLSSSRFIGVFTMMLIHWHFFGFFSASAPESALLPR